MQQRSPLELHGTLLIPVFSALSPSSGEEKQSGDGDCTLGAGGTGNQNQ